MRILKLKYHKTCSTYQLLSYFVFKISIRWKNFIGFVFLNFSGRWKSADSSPEERRGNPMHAQGESPKDVEKGESHSFFRLQPKASENSRNVNKFSPLICIEWWWYAILCLSETLSDTCQMMSQELEAPPVVILGHWSVYMINATFNDLLNQYLATTNHNVENIV